MAHSKDEVLAGLAALVNDETGVPVENVVFGKKFADDLDIDSISMMTIVVNAEEEFGVKIPDDKVSELVTVDDAVNYIVSAQS
jgi:acyl carrier protein